MSPPSRSLSRYHLLHGEFTVDRPASPAWLTVPLSVLYGWGAAGDARRQAAAQAFRPPVPVISVGNLAVGGTGKTPCVIALGKLIGELEPALAGPNAVAVLSRGYGRASKDLIVVDAGMDYRLCGDEPLLIKQALPRAAVVVHADRARAARHAVEQLGARLILLDDGFQHRKLARDLDLVLVDGSSPLGNGRMLPAGPLREPVQALERASILIGVGIETEAAAHLAGRFEKPFVPAVPRMTLPVVLERDLSCPVFVLTSIARPARFLRMLDAKGLNIKGELAFRDHHHFSDQDLLAVILAARHCGAKAVVCTAKDRVRLPLWPEDVPLHVAEFALDFQRGGILPEILAEWVGKAMKVNEK